MGLDPAVGGEVHGDAGGEEQQRDGKRACDPGELDASAEHEVVEDAEDEDEDGGLGEEGGAAAAGDDHQVEQGVGGRGVASRRGADEAQAGWILVGLGILGLEFTRGGVCCIFVKHNDAFVVLPTRMTEREGEVQ
jgi:hypothetical protein